MGPLATKCTSARSYCCLLALVSFRAHLLAYSPHNRYLSADSKGKLTADSESKGANETWTYESKPDGRFSFKSTHNYFLGGSGSALHAFARSVGETELWTVHLALHPQVAIRNVNRKKFIHLVNDQIVVDEPIPWGDDAMIIIEFHNGQYALRACNGKYLQKDGKLVDSVSPACLFVLEFRDGAVAFKSNSGKYLQGYGTNALLCERRETIGADELFEIEDSEPQLTLQAHSGKYVTCLSTKCEASGTSINDETIFQLESAGGGKWVFKTVHEKYFVSNNGVMESTGVGAASAEPFSIEFHGTQIALKASNGKYVTCKSNGVMATVSDSVTDKELFRFELINRPQLILRGEFGFVANRNGRLVSNAVQPEVFRLHNNGGKYTIQVAGAKWVRSTADGVFSVDNDAPEYFTLEFVGLSKVLIRAQNGAYLKGDQAGFLKASSTSADSDCQWEF
jgi:hypothetical protein